MKKMPRADIGKFSQFFPSQATIVTSHYDGRDNAMAVAWHMPISAEPAMYGVGIAPSKLSHQLITRSREFGVNFMPFSHVRLVAATSGPSGNEIDKFETFQIKREPSIRTSVPVLLDAYAAFECVLEEELTYGDHTLFIGRVVAVHQAIDAYDEKNLLDVASVKPVFYLGRDRYMDIASCTAHLQDRFTTAKEFLGE